MDFDGWPLGSWDDGLGQLDDEDSYSSSKKRKGSGGNFRGSRQVSVKSIPKRNGSASNIRKSRQVPDVWDEFWGNDAQECDDDEDDADAQFADPSRICEGDGDEGDDDDDEDKGDGEEGDEGDDDDDEDNAGTSSHAQIGHQSTSSSSSSNSRPVKRGFIPQNRPRSRNDDEDNEDDEDDSDDDEDSAGTFSHGQKRRIPQKRPRSGPDNAEHEGESMDAIRVEEEHAKKLPPYKDNVPTNVFWSTASSLPMSEYVIKTLKEKGFMDKRGNIILPGEHDSEFYSRLKNAIYGRFDRDGILCLSLSPLYCVNGTGCVFARIDLEGTPPGISVCIHSQSERKCANISSKGSKGKKGVDGQAAYKGNCRKNFLCAGCVISSVVRYEIVACNECLKVHQDYKVPDRIQRNVVYAFVSDLMRGAHGPVTEEDMDEASSDCSSDVYRLYPEGPQIGMAEMMGRSELIRILLALVHTLHKNFNGFDAESLKLLINTPPEHMNVVRKFQLFMQKAFCTVSYGMVPPKIGTALEWTSKTLEYWTNGLLRIGNELNLKLSPQKTLAKHGFILYAAFNGTKAADDKWRIKLPPKDPQVSIERNSANAIPGEKLLRRHMVYVRNKSAPLVLDDPHAQYVGGDSQIPSNVFYGICIQMGSSDENLSSYVVLPVQSFLEKGRLSFEKDKELACRARKDTKPKEITAKQTLKRLKTAAELVFSLPGHKETSQKLIKEAEELRNRIHAVNEDKRDEQETKRVRHSVHVHSQRDSTSKIRRLNNLLQRGNFDQLTKYCNKEQRKERDGSW